MERGFNRIVNRNYLKLNEEERFGVQLKLWTYFLIDAEGDHLEAIYDIHECMEHFEEEQRYEICQALNDVIENYDRLSHIKLR